MHYLYHGSPYKIDVLKPSQAVDVCYDKGCQFAVYATSNKDMAICFALGCVEENEGAERIMMPEYGNKMVFRNCHPNFGGKGYVYVVDRSQFEYAYGTQWVSFSPVIPEEIIDIDVDDYIETHCIIEKNV